MTVALTSQQIDELLPTQINSIGVSGTRERLTSDQEHAFFDLLVRSIRRGATEVHHGACTGLDQFAHFSASSFMVFTHVHPPVDKKYSAESMLLRHNRRVEHEPLTYAERNQVIVDNSDLLLAAPQYPEKDTRSKRSGTWQTIRKADTTGKLVLYAMPDGTVHQYVRGAADDSAA